MPEETYQVTHKLLQQQLKQVTDSAGKVNLNDFLRLIDKEYITSEKKQKASLEYVDSISIELLEHQKEITKSARHAGMTEVATSVLHNIGNLLNSVNVSVTLISEIIKYSKVDKLRNSCELINENMGDLGKFFSETEKGKTLAHYLLKISEWLLNENVTIKSEIDKLEKNVQHIKSVIRLQQNMVGGTRFSEPTNVIDIIKDVLQLVESDLKAANIKVYQNYEKDIHTIFTDTIKLEQVFINLFKNATEALLNNKHDDRRISVTVKNGINKNIIIEVTDNGVGVLAENSTKIFSFGFSTKHGGHGFGLHTSALALTELGGTLSVHSDGLNKGSTFTIDLPYGNYLRIKNQKSLGE